ncbi:Uu.00g113320.m01.CDS01 [Anthostomella pinea]|uniref:Uu.00g113320.m01.CDS01 n=1 Tax=Anthostomella pinea TaxID=933095 RepID=A0AAI8VFC5_9PEZI|nr:Uu.00g113320.m01.CDS01 [Anthostomella pinea]
MVKANPESLSYNNADTNVETGRTGARNCYQYWAQFPVRLDALSGAVMMPLMMTSMVVASMHALLQLSIQLSIQSSIQLLTQLSIQSSTQLLVQMSMTRCTRMESIHEGSQVMGQPAERSKVEDIDIARKHQSTIVQSPLHLQVSGKSRSRILQGSQEQDLPLGKAVLLQRDPSADVFEKPMREHLSQTSSGVQGFDVDMNVHSIDAEDDHGFTRPSKGYLTKVPLLSLETATPVYHSA